MCNCVHVFASAERVSGGSVWRRKECEKKSGAVIIFLLGGGGLGGRCEMGEERGWRGEGGCANSGEWNGGRKERRKERKKAGK